MTAMRWAVVGPGRIAHRFAQALAGLPDAQLVAELASRAGHRPAARPAVQLLLQRNLQATQAVLQRTGQPSEVVDAPFAINGFEGEIEEAMRCIRAGLCQSPAMSHNEGLATLAWMDRLRASLGVCYPGK